MSPVIRPSSELRKNYNAIAEICRTRKAPVFLTKNGEGDTVIMDMETYSRREEDLAARIARRSGVRDYTVEEFRQNMLKAIERGAAKTE
ncbi:MAG: type II toxin-antitoxin system Phd/YefM family antitoxin [Spirochaetaceae bacterium]|jgi:PHD/YefM family antitoxin component YafN of YafNO toxin-antitoxin module|nr:type II toxin-antitoxin system Phd/YefM family antitoxin [Spirochaetaceae bacterium]